MQALALPLPHPRRDHPVADGLAAAAPLRQTNTWAVARSEFRHAATSLGGGSER
jgi:hypothetical protein